MSLLRLPAYRPGQECSISPDRSDDPVSRQLAEIAPQNRTWLIIALTSACGLILLYPLLPQLWDLWMGDPLRSMGMFLPPISVILTLRVWRQEGWQLCGTWWGFVPLLLSVAFAELQVNMVARLHIGSMLGLSLIPGGLLCFSYGSGVVLLFAGFRVWRKALFPLALLLLVNPLPSTAATLIDMPLQRAAAHIARRFATAIHFVPSNTQLQLMFSPDFGLFIAPGCDGMRGAVTLGYIALIIGYWKRFSFVRWATVTAGAVLLGHLFNLLRLCTLVLYYRVAIGHSWLQSIAKQADYAIGSCLFLVATTVFLRFVLRMEGRDSKSKTEPVLQHVNEQSEPSPIGGRAFAFVSLILASIALYGVQMAAQPHPSPEFVAGHRLPSSFGDYELRRTWTEESGDTTVLEDGAYVSRKTGREVVLAVWIAPFFHNAQECMLGFGLDPQSRSPEKISTLGRTIAFDTATYRNGSNDMILATAGCTPFGCTEQSRTTAGAWMSFAPPDLGSLGGVKRRAVPMLVRIERPHEGPDASVAQKELSTDLLDFMSHVDFLELSRDFQ